ncbi:MAG: aminoglycoside 6-adenylyltransferase [Flavobacteriaceae bacterium]|jgi:aminoglycoside 6-adenylyltransferase|nr:aminoglycoside 6-adenylyltransferase [Flavobacteriaceae bacterium]
MPILLKDKIVSFAQANENIRAVILNGSRANSKVVPDAYQDYDIVYFVSDLEKINSETLIHQTFGTPIIQQLPDVMLLGNNPLAKSISYTYLMIFDDNSRLDLTLFPLNQLAKYQADSLSVVWIDKDDIFQNIPPASDVDYHVQRPSQREFTEVCNEFWWCTTNVAKGLARQEIVYAKDMMENVVRPMFLQLIAWKIGSENNFSVSVGKSGKYIKQYLSDAVYAKITATYCDATIENNWTALYSMCLFFQELQRELGQQLQLKVNTAEGNNSLSYLRTLKG